MLSNNYLKQTNDTTATEKWWALFCGSSPTQCDLCTKEMKRQDEVGSCFQERIRRSQGLLRAQVPISSELAAPEHCCAEESHRQGAWTPKGSFPGLSLQVWLPAEQATTADEQRHQASGEGGHWGPPAPLWIRWGTTLSSMRWVACALRS